MGFIPKSERGKQEAGSSEKEIPEIPPGPEYEELKKKRDELNRQRREYDRRLRLLKPTVPEPVQFEFDLGKPLGT